ncbi:MAG: hypothetical protein JWR85_1437 [Marmoricola sp.]|nr:hypothetical protein [Marmoricola sp.]
MTIVLGYDESPPGGVGEEFTAHRDALVELGRQPLPSRCCASLPRADGRSAQGMSDGLRTSSSVLRSPAAPVASSFACGSLTESSRESPARLTVELRSPR